MLPLFKLHWRLWRRERQTEQGFLQECQKWHDWMNAAPLHQVKGSETYYKCSWAVKDVPVLEGECHRGSLYVHTKSGMLSWNYNIPICWLESMWNMHWKLQLLLPFWGWLEFLLHHKSPWCNYQNNYKHVSELMSL